MQKSPLSQFVGAPLRSVTSRRRPTGVSRRQKRQLGFEALEDRRVMSANILATLPGSTVETFSSNTLEGQLAILLRELDRYASQGSGPVETHLEARSIPTDPLFGDQWHLLNSGQQVGSPDFQTIFATPGEDINVAPVWNEGIFGDGVVVAVIDSGVELAHPDLDDNIDESLQLDAITQDGDANPEVIPFDPNFPQAFDPTNAHGTAVAGLIAAEANNGLGGAGVAPGATLAPIRLIDIGQSEIAVIRTFRHETDKIDITNNSWGPADVRRPAGPTPDILLALRDSVRFGRDGLGQIHVFAAGNGGEFLDTSTYDGYVNTRYTIGVTGVDHDGFYNNIDGTVTGYPEVGASVLVAAPTGSVFIDIVDDTGIGSGLLTTDTTGNTGFNIDGTGDLGATIDRDFLEDERFTSRFNGTSGSTPIVSGVIALMLEANPNLSYRDVQEILVRSARQNAPLGRPADGLDKALGFSQPNTWIVNQTPLFHDPDPFVPTLSALQQIVAPTLNPVITNTANSAGFLFRNNLHYAPTPAVLTTGAGYTVSQGIGSNTEQLGYAHGVVDAELAVQLAKGWHAQNQNLPAELTFTTAVNTVFATSNQIPAAQIVEDLDLIVPGGLGGDADFINYWTEYLEDDPFADFDEETTRSIPLNLVVPDDNAMTVEHVEVSIDLSGTITDALDHLRIILVSPDGTHSELNHQFIDPSFLPNAPQPFLAGVRDIIPVGDPGSLPPVLPDGSDAPTLDFTFSTNRSWGERSDSSVVFDPTTNEPFINTSFVNIFDGFGFDFFDEDEPRESGNLLRQGWQVYFENYGPSEFTLNNIEIAWHGSPIDSNTERVMGFIGVDSNRDDLFNYSRTIQEVVDIYGDPDVNRLGEVTSIVDPDQEPMAANITVTARRLSDNLVVDQFITGADGNYYFDLVPDDYIISIEDPEGRTALDDSLTPDGFAKNYQAQWLLTSDHFQVWDYDSDLRAPINPETGAPFPFLDGNGDATVYGVRNVNFLLDPGPGATDDVVIRGVIASDTNGDGAFNADDVFLPDVAVFGDLNRNEVFDSGEPVATSNSNGRYDLVIPDAVAAVINVGVLPPLDWGVSNPASGLETFFVTPGDVISDVDFSLVPPLGGSGGNGSSQGGIILGTVFDDINGDALRQAGEDGVPGVTVYIDNNFNDVLDAGDDTATTNQFGAYVFTDETPGLRRVRIDLAPPNEQTLPVLGGSNEIVLGGAGTAYPIDFGVRNTAVLDYGDLPSRYGITTLSEDGARHGKGAWFLGARIDTELNGQPSDNADLDDLTNLNDEDGVVVTPLTPNSTGTLVATASRHGGYFKGWIDFDNDGVFAADERLVFSNPSDPASVPRDNWLLDVGSNTLTFDVPAINGGVVFARFRYGEFEIDSVTGFAQIGEVEDYAVIVNAPVILQAGDPGDFDGDDRVSGMDFLAWQRGHGTEVGAERSDGDADGDGDVDAADLSDWSDGFAPRQVSVSAPLTADFNLNGDVGGYDFLTWQLGVGEPSPGLSEGDGTGDSVVDGDDMMIWEAMFGIGYGDRFSASQGAAPHSVAVTTSSTVAAAAGNGSAPVDLAAVLGQRAQDALAGNDADSARVTDAVMEIANTELSDRGLKKSAGLLQRRRATDGDVFAIANERESARPDERAGYRDEVFAQLPEVFFPQ